MADKHSPAPKPERNALIGFPLVWYPMADKAAGPRAAIVTGPAMKHRDEILSMNIWEENADRPRLQRNVRRMGDPKLEQVPTLKEAGAWDFPEWFLRLTRMVDEAASRNKG